MSPFINALRRYRDPLAVVFALALPLLFYISNSRQPAAHTFFDRWLLQISAPVQWIVVTTLEGVMERWQRYVALIDVAAENAQLKIVTSNLRAQLLELGEIEQENKLLRQMVQLQQQHSDQRLLQAKVIGVSVSPLFRAIRIDQGSAQGVLQGAAVVTLDGVVGRIMSVGRNYADVMLIVDGNHSMDTLVQRSRARARAKGSGSDERLLLSLQYLARTADIQPGDMIVSSGLGASFPKGLAVGRVTQVERRSFGLYQSAMIEPSVDFAKLEGVIVVLSSKSLPLTGDGKTDEPPLTPEESAPAWEGELGSDSAPFAGSLPPR